MRLGIMQPYFMPYIGYISLIKHTNQFILLDTVQFIRHGWIERNRILKQNGGWQYIQVPIIKNDGRDTLIKDIRINNKENWERKIIAQLQHYKKISPYFIKVVNLLEDIFSQQYENISMLNKVSLEKILKYLEIDKKIEIFSEMDLKIDKVNAPDEWALNICKSINNADEYWNPPGGQSFFNKTKYENNNIMLKFQSVNITEYSQKKSPFEPALSIIDVMMFNSVEEIGSMLDKYDLI